jgi:hypothetical protein
LLLALADDGVRCTGATVQAIQKSLDVNRHLWSSSSHSTTPDDFGPDDVITMDKDVAKRNDLPGIANIRSGSRLDLDQAAQRFANDDQLPLHTGPQQRIG